MNLLEISKKRRATKVYNGNKLISKSDLNYIFEVINTAPSSMGLEQWSVISLRDKKEKEKYKKNLKFNGQRFIDSSDALIFVTRNEKWFKANNEDIKYKTGRLFKAISEEYNTEVDNEQLKGYLNYIETADHGNNDNNTTEWSKRQAYIASAYAMLAASEKGINSTPVEGFEKELTASLRENNLIDDTQEVSLVILLGYIDGVEHAYNGKTQLRSKIDDNFKII